MRKQSRRSNARYKLLRTANQRLCLHYRDNTSVSDPEDSFFRIAGHIQSYFISNHFMRAYQLAASGMGKGIGKLGWVKAIHRLKCNHAGRFYFQLYEYLCFSGFYMNGM